MEDLHKLWPHRWITPKAKVKESPIHGLITSATENIEKGELVAIYGGIIVPKKEIESYREKVGGIRGIQIDENFFICPTEREGGLFNHSCNQNLGFGSEIKIIAIRDIKAGDELLFDYTL